MHIKPEDWNTASVGTEFFSRRSQRAVPDIVAHVLVIAHHDHVHVAPDPSYDGRDLREAVAALPPGHAIEWETIDPDVWERLEMSRTTPGGG